MLPHEESEGNGGTALVEKPLDQPLLCGTQSQSGQREDRWLAFARCFCIVPKCVDLVSSDNEIGVATSV